MKNIKIRRLIMFFAIIFIMFSDKVNALEYVKCNTSTGIPKPIPQLTSMAFTLLIVGTPLTLILFSIVALIKAITRGNADDVSKVKNKLISKVIGAVLVFLVAGLMKFVLNQVSNGKDDKKSFIDCLNCYLYNSEDYCLPDESQFDNSEDDDFEDESKPKCDATIDCSGCYPEAAKASCESIMKQNQIKHSKCDPTIDCSGCREAEKERCKSELKENQRKLENSKCNPAIDCSGCREAEKERCEFAMKQAIRSNRIGT